MVYYKRIKYTITKGHELRLEVAYSKKISLTLLFGKADIFGSKMNLGKKYFVKGLKIALFAFDKSVIGIEGDPNIIYESKESGMFFYLKIHEVLEERRVVAQMLGFQGPSVLCIGPFDSGKTTIIRILSNFAVRMGWMPTMVELNMWQGNIALPGCISAIVLVEPWKIEERLMIRSPLVFYHGIISDHQKQYYKAVVECLATNLNIKAGLCNKSMAAGTFINTFGWIEDLGLELLLHQMESFFCDVVVVIGHDKLYQNLIFHAAHLPDFCRHKFDIVKLPRSGGVVFRCLSFRREERIYRIQKYFIEFEFKEISFSLNTVVLSSIDVHKIMMKRTTMTALPISMRSLKTFDIHRINMNMNMEKIILALSHGMTPEEVFIASIAGFLQVSNIDNEKKLISFYQSNKHQIPGTMLILTDI